MKRFYIASDYELMVDMLKSEIYFLKSSWQNLLGRPLIVLTLNQMNLGIYSKFILFASFVPWWLNKLTFVWAFGIRFHSADHSAASIIAKVNSV